VRLVGRQLLVFLEATLVDTTLVLPWTPVSPDEFFVAGDAGPRVERRAAASSEHTRVRAQAARPLRSVVRRTVHPARPMPRIAILTSNSD
jgi:hypothetical protein